MIQRIMITGVIGVCFFAGRLEGMNEPRSYWNTVHAAHNDLISVKIVDKDELKCLTNDNQNIPCPGSISNPMKMLILEHVGSATDICRALLKSVNENEREKIIESLDAIMLYRGKGANVFYEHSSSESQRLIDDAFKCIKDLFKLHNIKHKIKQNDWFMRLNRALSPDPVCDIKGLDKIAVLTVLFQGAQRNTGYPTLPPFNIGGELDNARYDEIYGNFKKALEEKKVDWIIDYYNNRSLKVDISEDTFDAARYNRDNGRGAAQSIIAELRLKPIEEKIKGYLSSQDIMVTKAKNTWTLTCANRKDITMSNKLVRKCDALNKILKHIPDGASGTIQVANNIYNQCEQIIHNDQASG